MPSGKSLGNWQCPVRKLIYVFGNIGCAKNGKSECEAQTSSVARVWGYKASGGRKTDLIRTLTCTNCNGTIHMGPTHVPSTTHIGPSHVPIVHCTIHMGPSHVLSTIHSGSHMYQVPSTQDPHMSQVPSTVHAVQRPMMRAHCQCHECFIEKHSSSDQMSYKGLVCKSYSIFNSSSNCTI